MNRLMLLLILACQIAVTTPISAEEIKLTTIVPDQTILRAKKGAIGDTYSNPTTIPDSSIPASGFLVEGNVGINTLTPRSRLEIAGDVQIGNDAAAPSASKAGALRYNSGVIQFCNGTSWVTIGSTGGGPVFLASPMLITLVSGINAVDVSSVVPSGATAVILQADVGGYWTSVAFPTFSAGIRIRKDAASQYYQLFSFEDSGKAGVTPVELYIRMYTTQGTFPITSARTFQYNFSANANDKFIIPEYIRVIGYYQ